MEFFVGVFENDENDQLKDLKEEEISIGSSIQKLGWDNFIRGNMGGKSLVDFLGDVSDKVTVFHFSGHHGHGLMKVVDGKVDSKPLIDFLNGCAKLKFVFINGCESQNFVDGLTNVPIVIGTTKKIVDGYAKEVATGFYKKIAENPDKFKTSESIEKLFQDVRNLDAMMANNDDKFANTRGGDDDDDDDGVVQDVYSLQTNKGADNFETRVTFNLNPEEKDVNKSYYDLTKSIEEEFSDIEQGELYRVYPYLFSKHLERLKPELDTAGGFISAKKIESLTELSTLSFQRAMEIVALHCQIITFLKYCGCSMLWTLHRNKKINLQELNKEQKGIIRENLLQQYLGNNIHSKGIDGLNQIFLMIEMSAIEDRPTWVKIKNLVHDEQEYLKGIADLFSSFKEETERNKVGNWIRTEDYLRDFVGRLEKNNFSLLRELSIWSVYNINFQRFRISDAKKLVFTKGYFPISTRPAEGKSELTEWDLEENTEIDIQSVYLMQGQNRILNLTPFYIDMNASDQNANKMEICYLEKYPKSQADVKLKYVSLKDNEKHEITEAEEEGDQKKIFEQMKYFWSLISDDA